MVLIFLNCFVFSSLHVSVSDMWCRFVVFFKKQSCGFFFSLFPIRVVFSRLFLICAVFVILFLNCLVLFILFLVRVVFIGLFFFISAVFSSLFIICIVLSRLCLVCAVFILNPVSELYFLFQPNSYECCPFRDSFWPVLSFTAFGYVFIFFSLVRHRNGGQPDPDLSPGDVSLCSPCTDILFCLGQALVWVVWCTFYGVITIHNKNCLSSVIGRGGVPIYLYTTCAIS